ncbi:smaller subunit of the mitochondrial processing protease [Hanseniaspora valbyensis NRRL Y-1626]|uniref:mitochondrial processing peptidase n=1 Tax=Hanseniaspora valbyensis NRRL Y-1626 TaxID=766949 RepID=A0A1B7TIE6_9ASCO|nr:smaller subunit of the mitochondrial processing protease [Hanseniaspora valbyensis NRRL Y-1626]
MSLVSKILGTNSNKVFRAQAVLLPQQKRLFLNDLFQNKNNNSTADFKLPTTPLKDLSNIKIESPITTSNDTADVDDILSCKISHLENGVTVVSKKIPDLRTATAGVFIKTGSRAEVHNNNGVAHFLEHLAFKGTRKRTKYEMESFFENNGCHLNAYTSRENTVYFSHTLKEHLENVIDVISDIVTNSKFEKKDIENERDVIIRESEFVDSQYDEVVFDHLHSIIFKESSLGFPILGPIKNIKKIDRQDIKSFTNKHYKGNRMVIVGVGAVEHESFVSIVDKYFGKLPKAEDYNIQETINATEPLHIVPTQFFSGEKKLQDNNVTTTNIAMAIQSASWSSTDYFKSILAQSIVGNWSKQEGQGTNNSSPLASAAAKANGTKGLAESYMSFSTTYGDVGIWGMYLVLDSNQQQDPKIIISEVIKEWKRLASGDISDFEFERCKSLLVSSLVLSLDATTPIFEEIGRQVCTMGKTYSIKDIIKTLESIQKDDVIDWCRKSLNKDSPLAIVSFGETTQVPSLSEIKQLLHSN